MKGGSGKTASSLSLRLHETVDSAIQALEFSVDQKFDNGGGWVERTRTFLQPEDGPASRHGQLGVFEASQGAPNTLIVRVVPILYYSRNDH